jgi:trans-aconitate 2-methyltransferase
MVWDPDQYLRFESERALPFHHLVAALTSLYPLRVVDLGCGSGGLTSTLLARWPAATILGIDSSEEMVSRARRQAVGGRIDFLVGDILTWRATEPVDLILANACFHWIEDHRALFDHLLPQLNEDGVLAFQVPANHSEPSHTLLGELCSSSRWRDRLDGLPASGVREPSWYLDELGSRSLEVTAWQTTYFHVLEGEDAVLEWVRGTTLRPVLERLPQHEHVAFLHEYREILRDAYQSHNGRTVFPFKRTFVVARYSA